MACPIFPVPINVILSNMLEVEADVENFARRVVALAADRSRLASMIMTLNCKLWLGATGCVQCVLVQAAL